MSPILKKLSVVALILVGCKASQSPVPMTEKSEEPISKPGWVLNKPVSADYYIGIGNAPLSDPDYQAHAKLEALDDLASEIRITVESSSLLNQVENQAGFSEQFQSAIKATTRQSIELHEQVAGWNDDNYYWVQYRLSKRRFDELRKKKKQDALAISSGHFTNGVAAEKNGEIVQSLHFYAQSIESLGGYLNSKNEFTVDGENIDLGIEAYARIVSVLSEMVLTSESLHYQFEPAETHKRIILRAETKNQVPIHGLSVITSQKDQKVTNETGEIPIDVSRKSAIRKITASADIGFFNQYPATKMLIQGITPAQVSIELSIPAITMNIRSIEHNLDQSMDQQILKSLVKKLLTSKGYRVIETSGEYSVEIHANTRKGTELSGLYTTYLDFTLDIKNRLDERVYSDSFSSIKGIHISYQTAGVKAYQNVEKTLFDDLKASLNKNFINKD